MSVPHLLPFPAPPDLRKQTVFLHDSQNGLGITVAASLLQHQSHPAVAIRTKAALSLFRDDFCKGHVFLWPAQTMDEIIVSAAGYLKEATHNSYWIFVSVPVDHCIFCLWPHFLPVERRKSRSNVFSMRSRWISYACSATIFLGGAFFLGLPLGRGTILASSFRSFLRSRSTSRFTTCLSLKP